MKVYKSCAPWQRVPARRKALENVLDGKKMADFRQFFEIWSIHKEKTDARWKEVRSYQYKIIDFLSDYENWDNHIGVLQAFRTLGKTTIVHNFIGFILYKNPKATFLVLSGKDALAKDMMRGIKEVITNHPLTSHLIPPGNYPNNAHDLFIRGSDLGKNPSVRVDGISSPITGRRAMWIVADDIEFQENTLTEDKRDKLKDQTSEIFNVVEMDGWVLDIGTPHHSDSIHDHIIGLTDVSHIKIPLMSETWGEWPFIKGKSVDDKVWPFAAILQKQKAVGSRNQFYSQWLLESSEIRTGLFNVEHIDFYDEELEVKETPKYFGIAGYTEVFLKGEKIVQGGVFWDIAVARTASADRSAVCAMFIDEDGHYYVHDVIHISGDLTEQCQMVCAFAAKYLISVVGFEKTGVGAFAGSVLRKYCTPAKIQVREVDTIRNKIQRIIDSLSVPIASRLFHISKNIDKPDLVNQITEFNDRGTMKRDDDIDAVSQCIRMMGRSRVGKDMIDMGIRVDNSLFKTKASKYKQTNSNRMNAEGF